MRPDSRFDENRSAWVGHDPLPPPRTPLTGANNADIAIIGGGFTGMSTAWHLSERFPDHRIVLLEAVRLANGGSGRNGGMMLGWKDGLASGDLDRLRRSYEAGVEGVNIIQQILAACGVEHLCRRTGSADSFTNPRDAELAREECERLQAAGIPIQFCDRDEMRRRLGAEHIHGAEVDPNAGQLDGLGMIQAMAPILEARGVTIHEGSPVNRIRESRQIDLELPTGTVRAGSIVLATNAYTPALGYFRHQIFALHSHVVGSRPLSMEEWASRGWRETFGVSDDSDRISYGAINPRGQLIFGGGNNATYTYHYGGKTAYLGTGEDATRHVKAKLLHYFPAFKDLDLPYAWTGPLGLTMSRVPFMGVRGARRNIYYAVGFSGHGVTLANLAGKVIRDLYSGDDSRWRGLSFYDRAPYWIPPDPFRWIGYQVYTRLTGRSPRRRMVHK